ncbi:hypothetical protein L208DRAFT_1323365, partial [Tricholoma matsutake]
MLYTPSIGLTLISIGQIDDAGFFCLFGNRHCKICRRNGELIGTIPKRQALYRVIQDVKSPSAHIVKPQGVTELVTNGIVTGLLLVNSDEPLECKACIKAKLVHCEIVKEREGERATMFGQEVWSDLWG